MAVCASSQADVVLLFRRLMFGATVKGEWLACARPASLSTIFRWMKNGYVRINYWRQTKSEDPTIINSYLPYTKRKCGNGPSHQVQAWHLGTLALARSDASPMRVSRLLWLFPFKLPWLCKLSWLSLLMRRAQGQGVFRYQAAFHPFSRKLLFYVYHYTVDLFFSETSTNPSIIP